MHPRSPNGRFIALFAVGVSLSICHWVPGMGTLAVTLAWTALSVKLSVAVVAVAQLRAGRRHP